MDYEMARAPRDNFPLRSGKQDRYIGALLIVYGAQPKF
jgi:hypothetical protein